MNISEVTELFSLDLCLFSAGGITYIIEQMINVFIVGVSVMDWLKEKPLTPADLLITAIGISGIIFQFIALLVLFCITFSDQYSTDYGLAFGIIRKSSVYCNMWLSVLLSVLHTLKISNFNNVLFLYLKKMISQRLLGLTITFMLLSIGYSLIEILITLDNTPLILVYDANLGDDEVLDFKGLLHFLWNLLPFLIYVVSSLTLLGSLSHHMYKMKRNKNVSSHLDTYYKTIKFTIVSFFFFALCVVTNVFVVFYICYLGYEDLDLLWNWFPMLHSMYIIYMSGRLRRHFLKILHSMTKCLLLGRGSDSRSEVLVTNQ